MDKYKLLYAVILAQQLTCNKQLKEFIKDNNGPIKKISAETITINKNQNDKLVFEHCKFH